MSISAADLRGMMRADAVGLVLGVLLMLTALVTLVLIGVLHRRAMIPLLWLGAFSLLYGFRLLERAWSAAKRAEWARADQRVRDRRRTRQGDLRRGNPDKLRHLLPSYQHAARLVRHVYRGQ